jgi:transposase InsO family protein
MAAARHHVRIRYGQWRHRASGVAFRPVHDQLATGSKLRILTVVDTFSRFSPAVVPWFGFRAPDVIEVLERVCSEVGYPASIRIDQGSEFFSRDLDLWAYTHSLTLDFSRPGKQTDTAFIERLASPAFGSTASSGRSA